MHVSAWIADWTMLDTVTDAIRLEALGTHDPDRTLSDQETALIDLTAEEVVLRALKLLLQDDRQAQRARAYGRAALLRSGSIQSEIKTRSSTGNSGSSSRDLFAGFGSRCISGAQFTADPSSM
jgi:hypothetical protein